VKRISFNEQHAQHIFERLRTYWRGAPKKCGGCVERAHIGRRLKRRIGRPPFDGPPGSSRTIRATTLGSRARKKKHAQSGKG
jgi:hypothetical protein